MSITQTRNGRPKTGCQKVREKENLLSFDRKCLSMRNKDSRSNYQGQGAENINSRLEKLRDGGGGKSSRVASNLTRSKAVFSCGSVANYPGAANFFLTGKNRREEG